MILSIGMIVKNEEKYLGQCLEAIKPILDNVDSELIIADTGSTDRTVEIAKKYTDNVFHFEWINDFSAARNSTLERSKGEWYMFIDADEIFQSCDNIISFFNSGEYKKYCTASFIVRSYTIENNGIIDRNVYNDFSAIRLTVKNEKIYFEKPIHEVLSVYSKPLKKLNVIADHYGYLFFSDEERRKKSERNIKPLLDKLESLDGGQPSDKDYLLYKEISDAYSLINDNEKAKEYIDLGLQKVDHNNIVIAAYYTKKAVYLYYEDENYNEVLELCENYFNKETNPSRKTVLISDITMYAYRGRSYYRLENYDEAASDFCDFFDLYEDYKNNKLNTEDAFFDSLYVMEQDVLEIQQMFLKSCLKVKKYSNANKYIKNFNIRKIVGEEDKKYINYVNNFIILTAAVMNQSSFNNLFHIFNQLNDSGRNLLAAEVRRSVFGADEAKKENIAKNLESVSRSDPRTEKSAQICCDYIRGKDIDINLVNNYIKKYGTELNEDIMLIMLDRDMDITAVVNADDYDPKEYVYSLYKIHDKPLELFEKYNTDSISKKGLEKAAETYKYVMIKATDYSSPISQMLIRQGILKKTDITKLLEKYASIGERYCSEYGVINVPWEIKAANISANIIKFRKEKDYENCLSEIQRLTLVYPEFAPVIKDYKEKAEKEKPAPFSEFEQMAMQVKKNIRAMIKGGKFADALNVLKEYQMICPNDGEIEILRSEINGSMK